MADTKASEDTFMVFDMNARSAGRIHDMVDGTRYELHAGKGTPVPERHALLFLRDEAFKVVDPSGATLASVAHLANERDGSRALADDETIARYEELTHDALLARAVLRPGAAFGRKSSKAELVAFLTNAPVKQELPRHLRARDTSSPEGIEDAEETGADGAAAVLGVQGRSVQDVTSQLMGAG
jgi:hypothetical protein